MSDFLNRMEAWQKADRCPERTATFLRDAGAATAQDIDKHNPSFGDGVKNGCATSAALTNMGDEIDAVKSYDASAKAVDNPDAKKVFSEIRDEEAAHIGELSEVLRQVNPEMTKNVLEGMDEAKELTGKSE